jgi:hypothetical protein
MQQAAGTFLTSMGNAARSVGEIVPGFDLMKDVGAIANVKGKEFLEEAAPKREIVRRGLGETGAFVAFDAGSEIARQAPVVVGGAAAVAGGVISLPAATALAIGNAVVQAYGAKYGQMRESGYNPPASAVRGTVSGIAEGVGEAYALKALWALGRPGAGALIRRTLNAMVTEASSEAGTESIDITVDKLTDELFRTDGQNKPLLDPNTSLLDAIAQVGKAGATGAIAGPVMGAMTQPFFKATVEQESGGVATVATLKNGIQVIMPTREKDMIVQVMDTVGIQTQEQADAFVVDFMQTLPQIEEDLEFAADATNSPLYQDAIDFQLSEQQIRERAAAELGQEDVGARPTPPGFVGAAPARGLAEPRQLSEEELEVEREALSQGFLKEEPPVRGRPIPEAPIETEEIPGRMNVSPELPSPTKGVTPAPRVTKRKLTPSGERLEGTPPIQARVAPDWVEPLEASDRPSLAAGETVGISPNNARLVQQSGTQATEVIDAVIGRINEDGTYDLRTRDGAVFKQMKRESLLTPGEAANFVRHDGGFELPALNRFLRKWITPDKPLADMTPEQQLLALGKLTGIVEKGLKSSLGAYVQPRRERPYIQLVHDLMRNQSEKGQVDRALRTYSHEIGHMIGQLTPEQAKIMGLGAFKGFSEVLRQSAASKSDMELMTHPQQVEWEKWKATNDSKQGKSKSWVHPKSDSFLDKRIKFAYGDELQALWRQWALIPGIPATFREQMANALSAFLNCPAKVFAPTAPGMGSGMPGVEGFRLHQVFQDWVADNPEVKKAYEAIRGQAPITVESIQAMMAQGQAGEAIANALKKNRGLGMLEKVMHDYVDNLWPMMNQFYGFVKDPHVRAKLEDTIDWGKFDNTPLQFYLDRNAGIRFGTELVANKLTREQMETFAFLKAVAGSRWLTQEWVVGKPGKTPTETKTWLKKLYAQEEAFVKANSPELGGFELREEVRRAYRATLQDMERLLTSRFSLFNPEGVTPADVPRLMAELGAQISSDMTVAADKLAVMDKLFKDWQDDRQTFLIDTFKKSGFFTDPTLRKMLEDKDYVTFQVVYHLFQQKNPSDVEGRIGTLADIPGVIFPTLEKDMRLWSWVNRKGMIRDTLALLQQHAPEMIVQAPRKADGSWGVIPRAGFHKDPIIVEENIDGKRVKKRYWVHESVALAFETPKQKGNEQLLGLTRWYTQWLTTFNPIFGLIRNPPRDIGRTTTNFPGLASLWKPTVGYFRNYGDAWRLVFRGEVSPAIQEVIDNRVLLSGLQYDVDPQDTQANRMQHLLGRSDPARQRIEWDLRNARQIAGRLWQDLKWNAANLVQVGEVASKASAWQYARDYTRDLEGLTEEQKIILARTMVRGLSGTPNLMHRGAQHPFLQLLLVFANPAVQGARGDMEAFQRGKLEYAFKSFMGPMGLYGALRTFAVLALSGALDRLWKRDPEDPKSWKQAYRTVPIQWLTGGVCLPLGFTSDGKMGMFRIPVDPVGQVFNSLIMNSALAYADEEFEASTGLLGAIEATPGIFPSLNPFVTGPLVDAVQLLARQNVFDPFRGRDVIPREVAATKDYTQMAMTLGKYYLFDKNMLGPLNIVFKLPFKDPTPRMRGSAEGYRWTMNLLEDVTKFPFFPGAPGLGKVLYFSDYGLKERAELGASARAIEKARATQTSKQAILQIAEGIADREALGEAITPQALREVTYQVLHSELSDTGRELILANPKSFARALKNYYPQMAGGIKEPFLQGQWALIFDPGLDEQARGQAILDWKSRYDMLNKRRNSR